MSPNGGARPKCPPDIMAPGGPAPKSGATKMALPGQKGHNKGHINMPTYFWMSKKAKPARICAVLTYCWVFGVGNQVYLLPWSSHLPGRSCVGLESELKLCPILSPPS